MDMIGGIVRPCRKLGTMEQASGICIYNMVMMVSLDDLLIPVSLLYLMPEFSS